MANAWLVLAAMLVTLISRIRTEYLFELMKEGKVEPKIVRFNNRIALLGLLTAFFALPTLF